MKGENRTGTVTVTSSFCRERANPDTPEETGEKVVAVPVLPSNARIPPGQPEPLGPNSTVPLDRTSGAHTAGPPHGIPEKTLT